METFMWNGDQVVHADAAGAKTQQQVDALGRIIQVVEDPSGRNAATTTYQYDALDDLTSVNRNGHAQLWL
jgi:YD repeat-containing protein